MRFLLYIANTYSLEIMRPLQEEIWQREHECAWFIEGKAVTPSHFTSDEMVLTKVKDAVDYAPDATFLPGNIVPSFIPGLKVQLFHGFEYKKKGHFRVRDCFDLYCTQGPLFTQEFLKLRESSPHFEVVETGWPKLDPLFAPNSLGKKDGKVILFAPTFSPKLECATALFETIVTLSHNNPWQWIVKFHPKMSSEIITQYQQATHSKLQLVTTSDIIPSLQVADVMLSDTSSVITEFLLLGKPVVTFNNVAPEPPLMNISKPGELADALQTALNNRLDESNLKQFVARMHPYQDGKSAMRVLDATLAEIAAFPRPGIQPKPKNWFRNLRLRKRLGYWRR